MVFRFGVNNWGYQTLNEKDLSTASEQLDDL
ncbi:Uncharacterised protein [Streptococcus pneumoniae]|nr:Uncharacterised protein [Streptococcus pneumoniae]CWJ55074.1 Uncharacterised protein [Streptococcus pneumoniae]